MPNGCTQGMGRVNACCSIAGVLNAYKQSPASKSKRRRWGYGGMLMSGGGKAPSDKLRSSMRS